MMTVSGKFELSLHGEIRTIILPSLWSSSKHMELTSLARNYSRILNRMGTRSEISTCPFKPLLPLREKHKPSLRIYSRRVKRNSYSFLPQNTHNAHQINSCVLGKNFIYIRIAYF